MSYRNTASFGKRAEYFVIAQMLKQGLDCYIPLGDDNGIDVVVRRDDKSFVMVQIKARSKNVKEGNAGSFGALIHEQKRDNYFFVFYSERMQKSNNDPFYWILSSEEFLNEAQTNNGGKNKGKKFIKFNGYKKNHLTGIKEEYTKERYIKYVYKDFCRIFE